MPRIPNQYRAERISCTKIIKNWWISSQPKIIPACQSKIKAIIFDLDGVLCTTNIWQAYRIIGLKVIIYYIIDQWKLPDESFLYKALADIPAKSKITSFAKDNLRLPGIIIDWQCNLESPNIIMETIIDKIKKSSYSQAQKNFLYKVVELKMNPEKLISSRKIIPGAVLLLHQLKDSGYDIYILSNWDFQSFPLLKKQFPEIFTYKGKKMFDGIITSGHISIAKPYHRIYENILTEYNISAEKAIFIDDVIENVQAAQKVGIKSIHCIKKNITHLKTHLIKALQKHEPFYK